MAKQATLIKDGQKKIVDVGSQEASRLLSAGWKIFRGEAGSPEAVTPTGDTGGGYAGSEIGSFLKGVGYQYDPSVDEEAQMWQYMSGGDMEENPYMAYMRPREHTDEDGNRFLRIPKNQHLQDLATFYNDYQGEKLGQRGDLGSDFLKYQDDKFNQDLDIDKYALDVAKEEWDQGMDVAKYELDVAKANKPSGGAGKTVGMSEWASKLGIVGMSLADGQQIANQYQINKNNYVSQFEAGFAMPQEVLDMMVYTNGGGIIPDVQESMQAFADQQVEKAGTKNVWMMPQRNYEGGSNGWTFYRGLTPITRETFRSEYQIETGSELSDSIKDGGMGKAYKEIFPEDMSFFGNWGSPSGDVNWNPLSALPF